MARELHLSDAQLTVFRNDFSEQTTKKNVMRLVFLIHRLASFIRIRRRSIPKKVFPTFILEASTM
jgi:hypothetical protein